MHKLWLTGLGAADWVLPPVVRRGEPVCPGREAGCRASAAGPGAKPELDEQRSARFGARTWMSAADFDRRQGWRRSKPIGACRGTNGITEGTRRRRENKRGIRPLVLFAKESGSFQSHSPSRAAAAKPRRGRSPRVLHGAAMPIRLVTPHPSPLPQGERGWLPWCNALRLLHPTVLPQGRGNGYRGRLRFANRPYSTRFDLTNCPKRRIRMGA